MRVMAPWAMGSSLKPSATWKVFMDSSMFRYGDGGIWLAGMGAICFLPLSPCCALMEELLMRVAIRVPRRGESRMRFMVRCIFS